MISLRVTASPYNKNPKKYIVIVLATDHMAKVEPILFCPYNRCNIMQIQK